MNGHFCLEPLYVGFNGDDLRLMPFSCQGEGHVRQNIFIITAEFLGRHSLDNGEPDIQVEIGSEKRML